MADGLSGGVQQWIIGVASALSRLDGREEYLFLVSDGHAGWLLPYLGGPCRVFQRARQVPRRHRADAEMPARPRRPLVVRLARKVVRRARRLVLGPHRRPEDPQWLSSLDQAIRETGIDVMHFPRQSAFLTSVPSIYQPWDLQHLHLPEFFSPEARARRDTTYREFCAQAERIVVATRWVKDDVSAQYDIDPGCIAVVNPPPVTQVYEPPTPGDVEAIANRLQLRERFAFYPAQTWGHKNHRRLLEALASLRDDGVDVPLVCSGHPNEGDAAVLDFAAELGLTRLVKLLGFLTPAEIQAVYARATVLVFPSLYEGWGLPILEAFAADLPVACSNATSLPDLVGDAALVFEATDVGGMATAIRRLWVDDQLRVSLVGRGRQRLGQFDWDRTARTLRAHYRQVAGRPLSREDRALLEVPPLV
jgi:glycosyltransferase involved in cell wall biosynthesis